MRKHKTHIFFKWLHGLSQDITGVIFPELCSGCGNRLYRNEEVLCLHCMTHMPQTHFHKDAENPVYKIFWGRVQIEFASAFLFFSAGGMVQQMIHKLKYKGRTDVGIFLGQMYGAELNKAPFFAGIDVIVPVPLHEKKLKKRGYNQSEMITQGLGEAMQKPVNTNGFIRKKNTSTQTKKGRYKRWENVGGIFGVASPEVFENKHVLLVDDVITTGATIEACAEEILKCPGAKVSVVAMACAMHI